MKKNLLLVVTFLVITLAGKAQGNSRPDYKDGIFYHLDEDNNTATVIEPFSINDQFFPSYKGDIVIPEVVSFVDNGVVYRVTGISQTAFHNNVDITSIVIPGTVDVIKYETFLGCDNLRSMTIKYGVREIEGGEEGEGEYGGPSISHTVDYLKNLKNLFFDSTVSVNTIGKGGLHIGAGAFMECKFLENVSGGNSMITSIGDYAFSDCSSLKNITIPNSVKTIGFSAFSNCTGLTSVNLPNSIENIGSLAFANCSDLASITIPQSLKSMGGGAFHGCSNLDNVYISDIEAWCNISFGGGPFSQVVPFSHMYNLYLNGVEVSELVIPNSITTIGQYTFSACNSLKSVTIPESVTIIGDYAFSYCPYITDLHIGNSVKNIGDKAFYYNLFLTNLWLGNSVEKIGDYAFTYCERLTSLIIPKSVLNIGLYAFGRSGFSLTNISVEEGNLIYDSREDCNAIIETETNKLIAGCKNSIIPNSVKTIGHEAFYPCPDLTYIYIPSSVTCIEYGAFAWCGLTKITLPPSIENIGEYAFKGCSYLTDVTALRSDPTGYYCESNAFDNTPTSTALLHVPAGCQDAYAGLAPWNQFECIVDDITGIEGTHVNIHKFITDRYNLQGLRVQEPQRGVNIIRYSDGTAKKVHVK